MTPGPSAAAAALAATALLSCAGPTSITVLVRLAPGTPAPDEVVLDVGGPDGALVSGARFPDDGAALELPGTILILVPPDPVDLAVSVRGETAGAVTTNGMAMVRVRPHRDSEVEVVLGGGGDAGTPDAATDAGPDAGAPGTDSGTPGTDAGPPPPSVVCTTGAALVVVTTADDERDGPSGATAVAEVGGAGDVSLREALVIANNTPGPEEIRFDPGVFPPTAPVTIVVGGGAAGPLELPPLDGGDICLDGAGAGVIVAGAALLPGAIGLRIESANNLVANLTVVSFASNGILVFGPLAAGNVVRDCWVGVAGAVAMANGDDGIEVSGGATGTVVGPGNVVGANLDDGIQVDDPGTDGTLIIGNFIGVDPGLGMDFGNASDGITVDTMAGATMVGGASAADANVIGFNGSTGVHISGPLAGLVVVRGNLIGADAAFATMFGNGNDGIHLTGAASGCTIGPGNTIGFNGDEGISVADADTITITANYISANASSGILVNPGENGGILEPAITAATAMGASGTTSAPDGSVVELFSDPGGEGRCFVALGLPVAGGTWSFTGTVTACAGNLTATVTNPAGNTSVFSPTFPAP